MKYEFTDQEVKALVQALDITTKTHGLNSAEACIVLAKKLADPIKEEPIKEKPAKYEED